MKKLNKMINSFRFAGLSEEEMKLCMPEVRKRNVSSLNWMLQVILAVLLVLTIVSMIPGSGEEGNRVLYAGYAAIVLVQFLFYRMYFIHHPEHSIICTYAFMFTVYSFGLYEATCLGSESTGAVFCVFLVAVPVLVIDRPLNLAIMTVIQEILLLFMYFNVGNRLGDPFVVINSMCCMGLGISCSCSLQKTKFSDIRNHLMLEVQRDTDMMTGACSRVAYIRDIGVMNENGVSAGVVYADVNGLKKTNDTLGHEAGDRLIKSAFSTMLKFFHEPGDRIYRVGGDEFVIVSLMVGQDNFNRRLNDMKEYVKESHIISCGGVWLDNVKNAEEAIRQAEKLMYYDKEQYYRSNPHVDRRKRV